MECPNYPLPRCLSSSNLFFRKSMGVGIYGAKARWQWFEGPSRGRAL